MQITDDMVERALAAVRHDDYGLGNNCIPFYTKATEWWMRGEPNHKFDNVESAKQYAVHKQMRAALEAALNHAGDGPGRFVQAETKIWRDNYRGDGTGQLVCASCGQPDRAAVIEECARVAEKMTECIRPYVNSQADEKIPCPVAAAIRALADKGTQR